MNKYQEHQDLIKISFYSILAAIALISLIAILANASSLVRSETVYDNVANLDVDNKNTGSIAENTVSIIGVEHISKTGIDANINNKSINLLREFITLTHPETKSISVKDKTPKAEGDTYTYTVISDVGTSFYIKVQDMRNGNYKISISDKNNEIFTHESKDYIEIKKDPRLLAKSLPKTFYDSDPTVSVTSDYDGNYFINVNACGDKEKINYAKKLVDEWTERNGFDPSAIKYTIPNYCDGVN